MNKALLAIDFINDIAHPDGRIAASAAHVVEQDAIAHANQALAHARAHGWLVILIKVGFDGGYLLQPKGSPMSRLILVLCWSAPFVWFVVESNVVAIVGVR